MGPLLFSIYTVSGLPSICDDVSIIMYAGDTFIYTHGKSATEITKTLTKAIQMVALWVHNSRLTLNLEKLSMFHQQDYTERMP